MKIPNTELEYNEADEVALRFYLGKHSESMEEWAQRVWQLCHEYKERNGKWENGKPMPDVYARDPKEIWEEKKAARRIAIMRHLVDKHPNKEECIMFTAMAAKNPPKMKWSNSHKDEEILKLKTHPDYTTADEKYDLRMKEWKERCDKANESRDSKVAFYRAQGRSDDDIRLTHPELAGAL